MENGFDVARRLNDVKTKPPEAATNGGIDQDKGTAIPYIL